MAEESGLALEQSGRLISEGEVDLIGQVVALFPQLSLAELGATIAEHLGWYTASGTIKGDACVKLLLKLEGAGELELSERQRQRSWRRPPRPIKLTEATDAAPPIAGSLRALGKVELDVVDEADEKRLWNEYVKAPA